MSADAGVVVTRPAISAGRAALSVALVGGFAAILYAMGRPLICPCGEIKLWHGAANDGGTSQHIADWYSLSHVIHGFIFYGAAVLIGRLWGRPLAIATALIGAIAVEGAWELLENSPIIIDRYRAATVSDAFAGDSVLNSAADIGFMILGFTVARLSPTWTIVAAAIAMELLALYVIRDNLTLNVIMILHPIDAIRDWQAMR
ncbi:DUF2585 family protein [Methylopila turkensis]|uniref:DUF2585 family protein n=1 Tax=Methylopila turkensis TaxID=1437816 RepID=UPI0022F331F6|nr:DUF2585 family protein [Methylopila turkensis]